MRFCACVCVCVCVCVSWMMIPWVSSLFSLFVKENKLADDICYCCWLVRCFFLFRTSLSLSLCFPFILYASFILYDFSLFIHLSFVFGHWHLWWAAFSSSWLSFRLFSQPATTFSPSASVFWRFLIFDYIFSLFIFYSIIININHHHRHHDHYHSGREKRSPQPNTIGRKRAHLSGVVALSLSFPLHILYLQIKQVIWRADLLLLYNALVCTCAYLCGSFLILSLLLGFLLPSSPSFCFSFILHTHTHTHTHSLVVFFSRSRFMIHHCMLSFFNSYTSLLFLLCWTTTTIYRFFFIFFFCWNKKSRESKRPNHPSPVRLISFSIAHRMIREEHYMRTSLAPPRNMSVNL